MARGKVDKELGFGALSNQKVAKYALLLMGNLTIKISLIILQKKKIRNLLVY
jgi:hypothetical protein